MKARRLMIWAIFTVVELIGMLWLLIALKVETGMPGWFWWGIYSLQFAVSVLICEEKVGGLPWKQQTPK